MLNKTLHLCLISMLPIAAPLLGGPTRTDYARLPLSFELNRGQGPRTARYLARGAQYTVGVEDTRTTIAFRPHNGQARSITIAFPGGSPHSPVAQDPLPGKVNYFLGRNSRSWLHNVPTWGSVRHGAVWPGIDVVWYGVQGRLEYDFNIAPHADPSQIRMRFSGAGVARLDESGDLLFAGNVRQHRPVAYQERAGIRAAVDVRYRLLTSGEAAFSIGPYDRSLPLVVDPSLTYASYFGGEGNDGIVAIKADSSGALYVAGFTSSASFHVTAGALQSAYKGTQPSQQWFTFGDAFVAKFSAAGQLVYSTYLGGTDDDVASSIAVDSAGNAYVGGATRSADFPVTAGAFQTKFGGAEGDPFTYGQGDGFVVKLSPDGSKLVYGTYIGGAMNDGVLALAVDTAGNVTAVGDTLSTDFPTTAGAISTTFRGAAHASFSPSGDAFLARLNHDGTALTYSTYIGGGSHDYARGVALDSQGNAYLCGSTYSSDFPVTPGAAQTTFRGVETDQFGKEADDGFVMKIDSAGKLVYSTYLGGSSQDSALAIAIDAAGAAYVTGRTRSSDFPVTSGAPQRSYGGNGAVGEPLEGFDGDAFVAKLNPAGSALVYSTYLGSAGDDAGFAIAVDGSGSAWLTGYTLSSAFPITGDALQTVFGGFGGQGFLVPPENFEGAVNSGDAFLVKINPTGAISYSSFFGGSADDTGTAIALDSAGDVYIAGVTVSPSLPVTPGAVQPTYAGANTAVFPRGDAFLTKFAFGGALPPPAASITFLPGVPTSGAIGAQLSSAVTVTVADASGNPIAGASVSFSGTNAAVSPATATTDASGHASTTVTLGNTVGAASVTASVSGLPAITLDLTATPVGGGPTIRAVDNAASYDQTFAPGGWIAIFGANLADKRVDATTVPFPTQLGGVQVLVNGKAIPLQVVLPGQINGQLPYDLAPGNAQVVVQVNGASSPASTATINVTPTAPAVFAYGDNRAAAQNFNADGTVTLNGPGAPVIPGNVLILYFNGQGALDNPIPTGSVAPSNPISHPKASFSVTIGGKDAHVNFVGMTPGSIGLAQANVVVPDLTPAGDYKVVVTLGGKSSKTDGPLVAVGAKP